MSEIHDELHDGFTFYTKVLVVTVLVLVAVGACGAVARLAWWPVEKRVEREVFVQSHQYQEARKEAEAVLEQEIARVNVQIATEKDPVRRAALIGQRNAIQRRLERERSKRR